MARGVAEREYLLAAITAGCRDSGDGVLAAEAARGGGMTPLEHAISAITGDDIVAAKVCALMRGYDARWSHVQHRFRVLSVEEMVGSDLINPSTNRISRSFRIAGKIDVRADRDGRQVIIDHKTCSEDITDPNAAYWRQLIVESQPSHYMLMEWQNGRKIDEAVWDVVRKPTISPKKLTTAEAKAVILSYEYCGRQLTDEDVLAVQSDGRETLAMYEARLAYDCTYVRPEWYFQRRTVVRIDAEMIDYAAELWADGQEVLNARNTERHGRNAGACMNYGRPCKFLGICSGHDDPDSPNWTRKRSVHNELPDLNGDGRDVLTNSRLSTFRTCRRKHYYEYELGIERVEEEEAESLYFGTQWHLAQEAWWAAYINEEVAYGDNAGSAGSELATAAAK
jgi:hypothetical protein